MNPNVDSTPHRMTMTCEIKPHEASIAKHKTMAVKGICQQVRDRKQNEKKIIALVTLLLTSSIGWSQDQVSSSASFWEDPFNHPLLPLYVVSLLVLVTIILVMITAAYTLRILNIFIENAAKEKADKLGLPFVKEISLWERTWQRWNSLKPLEEEGNLDMGHDFDGIRELDNHLPPWWKLLFYITIIWGIFYIIGYHILGSFPLSAEEYQNELAQADKKAKAFLASQPAAAIDESTLVYVKDDAILNKGKEVFSSSCVPCHRSDGGGNAIGPNLTDEYWLHGGDIKNIFATIKNGVVEKGMPVWSKAMSPSDVKAVTFYVMSLQGTKPANAKAPQGELFKSVDKISTDTVIVRKDSLKVQAMVK